MRRVALLMLAVYGCGPVIDPTGPSAANRAPQIRSVIVSPVVVPLGGSASVVVDAIDPDGERLFYRFSATAGTVSVPDEAQPSRAVYVHGGGGSTSDLIVVTVTDSRNASTSVSAQLRLRTNTAPAVTVRSTGSCHPRCVVTFTADVFDADDDTLTYSWHGCAAGTRSTATCTIVAPTEISAIVIVNDGRGGTTTAFADVEGLNEPPAVSGGREAVGSSAIFTVDSSDPDGDAISCGWSGDCQCLGSRRNDDLECALPPTVGACEMTFHCSDTFGATGETTFRLSR